MAEYTSDQLRLILAMSADITSLQNSLKKASGDTKKAATSMNADLNTIGTRGGVDPTRRLQDGISKMQGSMRAATGNMTAQLNDISTTLLSGSSPFTVMVQQGSQVTQILQEMAAQAQRTGQSFSVFQLVGGAFKNLFSPMSLVVNGLILLAGVALPKVLELFKSSTEDMKKNLDALRAIVDEYGVLEPAAKKVIDQFLRQEEITATIKKMEDSVKALKGQSLDALTDSVVKFADVADAAMELRGPVEGAKLVDEMQERWQALIDTIESGQDPMQAINALISDFAKAEAFAPGIGFQELADVLQNEVLPNMERYGNTTQAVKKLQDILKTSTTDAVEKQKAYNDAIKEMQGVAEGPLTDVEKVLKQHAIALQNATTDVQRYNAELAKTNALSELNIQASEKFAEVAVSGLSDYAAKVSQVESGGRATAKNPLSSASGEFQFIDETFLKVARSMDEFSALTDKQIMSQKNNVEVQKRVFDQFTKQNAAALDRAGIKINDATLYLAHFLGAGGATRLLQAAPNRSAVSVLGPSAARANPSVIGGGATVQDVINWAQRKMGGAQATVSLADQQATTASAREEAEIRGEIGTQMDENIRRQEEQLKFAELMRDLNKKAADEGRTVSQEEIARAREIAAAWGQTQGAIEGHKKALADAKNLADALRSVETKTDSLNAELDAVNALGGAYDKLVYTQEKAALTSQLLAKAREDGTEATAAERAQIEAVADAQARALATQALYNQGQKEFSRAQRENTQAAQEMAETYANMATQFFTGFISDMRNGKTATEALSNALAKLGDQLLDMALNMLFQNLFKNLFSGLGGGGTGFFPAAPTMHGGGTVGLSRHFDGRRFSPLLWAGAPRFQAGGLVGLRPGEIPIIAHRGELVIPANQTTQTGPVTGDDNRQYNVSIKVDSNGRANLTEGNGTVLGKRLNAAVQEVIAREQRSGGLLAGTGPGWR